VKHGYFPHKGLHHSICWGLAKTAKLAPGQLVLDPMAGKGVVLLEAAAYWPSCKYLAGEADGEQLSKAAENLAYAASRGVLKNGSSGIGLLQADCRHIPLPSESVDAVLCDLPWGRQFGTEDSNAALYAELLAEVARVLSRQGGRAVLFTMATPGNSASMSRAIGATGLCLVREVNFRFGGNHNRFLCTLYCLAHSATGASCLEESTSPSGMECKRGPEVGVTVEDLFDWCCFEGCPPHAEESPGDSSTGLCSPAEATNFVFQDVKPLLELYRPLPNEEALEGMACGQGSCGPQDSAPRQELCQRLHDSRGCRACLITEEFGTSLSSYVTYAREQRNIHGSLRVGPRYPATQASFTVI